MADFRRWIIALAVLALFAGLASAQTGGGGGASFSCSANTSNTPTLRQEGITEQIGDILITCTGGNYTDGTAAPQVNITVAVGAQVTTRLVSTDSVSQALLLIDDPNSQVSGGAPVPGFGSGAGFVVCPNPHPSGANSGGCEAYGYHVLVGGVVYTIESAIGAPTGPGTQAPNVYQGVVQGSNVTFFGVPIVAPGSNGARLYRITGIRINASSLSAPAQVSAFIQTSNPSALPISNPNPLVGFISASLGTSVGAGSGFAQCVSQTLASAGLLTFTEINNFAAAFKTRVDPNVTGQISPGAPFTPGQGSALVQNVPGTIYKSESGFTPGALTGLVGTNIGLTDFGTRFHAIFTNLPAGVKLYISTVNVNTALGAATGPVVAPAPTSITASYAIAIPSDTGAEGTASTSTVTGPNGIPLIEIDTAGSTTASATWEVINTQPFAIDTYQFAVYASYVAAPGTNSPAIGAASVNLWYAPTSTVTTATSSDPIPRFLDASKPAAAFSVAACQTVLLFPFLTNLAGFDTGVAISNTSADPFGTVGQVGSCKLNWYGNTAIPVTTFPATGTIAAGNLSANTVSTLAPGFEGYMIAQCAFQYAHGFAFITDVGARQLAMGYLALVIPDPSLDGGVRPPVPFPNRVGGTTGEQLGQ